MAARKHHRFLEIRAECWPVSLGKHTTIEGRDRAELLKMEAVSEDMRLIHPEIDKVVVKVQVHVKPNL